LGAALSVVAAAPGTMVDSCSKFANFRREQMT
jgi:hypothetical protein